MGDTSSFSSVGSMFQFSWLKPLMMRFTCTAKAVDQPELCKPLLHANDQLTIRSDTDAASGLATCEL